MVVAMSSGTPSEVEGAELSTGRVPLERVVIVGALPKTRSGKILRGAIRSIASGVAPASISTIEDPAPLEAIDWILRGLYAE